MKKFSKTFRPKTLFM